jgi:hypothetical protein
MSDTMKIEVLEDGTIKVITDAVSMQNHMSAEAFLREANRLLGGETKRTRRMDVKFDLHHHLDEHTHDGHTHSH